jgi:ketosteroid isomerase-like protein
MRDVTPARGDAATLSETVRCAYSEDWLALGSEEVATRLVRAADPDLTFVPEQETGGPPIGVGEVCRLLERARDHWTSCRYLLEEVSPLSSGGVVVIGRVVATSRGSGSRASFPFVHVWHARGTRVRRIEAFADRAQAGAALGRSL